MATLLEDWPLDLLQRVEQAGLNAAAPREERWFDGWLLRLSPGKAKRARCINALAPGEGSREQRLRAARAAFAEAGLPLIFRVTPFTVPSDLDGWLAAQGFRRFDDTRVMVLPLERLPAAPDWPADLRLEPAPIEAFAELVGGWRGSPPGQRRAHAERLTQSPVRCQPYVLRRDGHPVSAAQCSSEGDLVGLYDVFTPPHARGAGLASRMCHQLLTEAVAAGCRTAYLQVDADNAPARAVYTRLGFRDAYSYGYRSDDPSAH